MRNLFATKSVASEKLSTAPPRLRFSSSLDRFLSMPSVITATARCLASSLESCGLGGEGGGEGVTGAFLYSQSQYRIKNLS